MVNVEVFVLALMMALIYSPMLLGLYDWGRRRFAGLPGGFKGEMFRIAFFMASVAVSLAGTFACLIVVVWVSTWLPF